MSSALGVLGFPVMCHVAVPLHDFASMTAPWRGRQAIERLKRLVAQTEYAALRRKTEIDTGMPLSDAQRNALAQLVFTHACRMMIFT